MNCSLLGFDTIVLFLNHCPEAEMVEEQIAVFEKMIEKFDFGRAITNPSWKDGVWGTIGPIRIATFERITRIEVSLPKLISASNVRNVPFNQLPIVIKELETRLEVDLRDAQIQRLDLNIDVETPKAVSEYLQDCHQMPFPFKRHLTEDNSLLYHSGPRSIRMYSKVCEHISYCKKPKNRGKKMDPLIQEIKERGNDLYRTEITFFERKSGNNRYRLQDLFSPDVRSIFVDMFHETIKRIPVAPAANTSVYSLSLLDFTNRASLAHSLMLVGICAVGFGALVGKLRCPKLSLTSNIRTRIMKMLRTNQAATIKLIELVNGQTYSLHPLSVVEAKLTDVLAGKDPDWLLQPRP